MVEGKTSGRLVSMVDKIGGCFGGAGSGTTRPGQKSHTLHLCAPFLTSESLPTLHIDPLY